MSAGIWRDLPGFRGRNAKRNKGFRAVRQPRGAIFRDRSNDGDLRMASRGEEAKKPGNPGVFDFGDLNEMVELGSGGRQVGKNAHRL